MSLTNAMEGAVSMSIYTVLKGEHLEVNGLFKALKATPSGLEGGREALFNKLYKELLSHANAEEVAVYHVVRDRIPEGNVTHAEKEHQEAKDALRELKGMDVSSEAWEKKLAMLEESVQHHVDEEEGTMFPKMQAVFTDEEVEKMATHFHTLKKEELKALE